MAYLSATEAAAVLGVQRETVPALAKLLRLGERDQNGFWRFNADAIARLPATGLVKQVNRARAMIEPAPAGVRQRR